MRTLDSNQAGTALISSLMVVVILAAVVAAIFSVSIAHKEEVSVQLQQTRALYVAETGISESAMQIAEAIDAGLPVPSGVGSPTSRIDVEGGRYWTTIVVDADETYTVTSHGATKKATRSIEAVLQPVGGSAFDHAVFAGNTSGDPAYTLRLSGLGDQADVVGGDVFSGGDLEVDDDATVAGEAAASGSVTGIAGVSGVNRPIPDIEGMDYATNHDFDVASLFTAATWESDPLGGSAFELPEENPAHIFRKNPDNRADEIDGTVKDDFFLEDPHEDVEDWSHPSGSDGHTITLSGTMGEPGADGNEKVYYVDGNLWVHNTNWLRLRFRNTDSGARVTFVVRGNVYFSDSVHLNDTTNDGVAFIAITDEAVEDSGNIYLGDPRFGTLDYMQAYLYAQNNFYDMNLSADGSKTVEILGNMTAGNQVSIQRDFFTEDGSVEHSKLTVNFDDRLSTGAIELPGIPRADQGLGGLAVVLWREVAGQ